MPKVRIRLTHPTMSNEVMKNLRDYWGEEPIAVYGYTQNGFFVVWDQQIADWGFLHKEYCVPCE